MPAAPNSVRVASVFTSESQTAVLRANSRASTVLRVLVESTVMWTGDPVPCARAMDAAPDPIRQKPIVVRNSFLQDILYLLKLWDIVPLEQDRCQPGISVWLICSGSVVAKGRRAGSWVRNFGGGACGRPAHQAVSTSGSRTQTNSLRLLAVLLR